MLPLRLATPDHFTQVREFLGQADYTEQGICRRMGLRGLHEYLSRGENPGIAAPPDPQDALDALLSLFLAGVAVNRDLLGGFIVGKVWESFEALDILCSVPDHPDQIYSPLALYPVRGLYIASDRWKSLDGFPLTNDKDYVFPAIHSLTHEFLELLTPSPCRNLLDLCSGTAVLALLASRHYAQQSWAVDITERATHFGEFNRRLNDLVNAKVLQGNLYEPVKGMKFDRIVAHPPFVPAIERGTIYADGGEDGEFVTRAIIEELPQFLKPNGRLYCATMGIEREGEPYEQRVRQWLGEEHGAFDVVFIADRTQGPAQFAYRATRNAKGSWELMDQWRAHLERLKVKNLVHGLLLIHAKESKRPAFTVQRRKGGHTGSAEIEWFRGWESTWAGRSNHDLVLQSRPLAAAGFEMHVVLSRQNGQLAPSKYTLRVTHPFVVEYECPSWVATLVACCDGKVNALQLFETGMRNRWIPSDLPVEEFASTLGRLVSDGFLEIDGFAPPRPETR